MLVVGLLGPLAAAQVPQPTLTLTLDATTLQVEAANTTIITGTVAYADAAPDPTGANAATVSLTPTLPEGWSATIEPASAFQMSAGQSVPVTVTLVAPAAGVGAPTGSLILDAAASAPGGRAATAAAAVELTRVDPVPPPPTPWYLTAWGLLLLIGVPLEAAALAGLAVWQRQRRLAAERAAAEAAAAHAAREAYLARETGVAIGLADGPREYGHQREVMYRLLLTNTSDRPRVGIVEVASVTNGWRAATAFTRVPLGVGERKPVTLVVTPDSVIVPGERAKVVVRAKPEEAVELDERLELDVVAPKSGVPADPHYKIVTVHREGANAAGVKPVKR